MKQLALKYYRNGYGCSQCIIKAADVKYNLSLSKSAYNMTGAMNTGFGIGGMCTVIIASVMVLGLLFDEKTVKSLRLVFLDEFYQKYKTIDCHKLRQGRTGMKKCEEIISDAMEILEKLIDKVK
jgi:C_GCAxxG_C_C family probable redox protein